MLDGKGNETNWSEVDVVNNLEITYTKADNLNKSNRLKSFLCSKVERLKYAEGETIKMTIGIYKITERETGRCYIGQSKDIEKRWKGHHKRFSVSDFDYEIIQATSTEQLDEAEIRFIDFFDSHRNGFNKTVGGSGIKVRFPAEETLRKRSESMSGRTFSKEHKQKMSEAAKNRPPRSEETRKKLSECNKGKLVSEETRKKLSQSLKGKIVSEEYRQKMSEIQKGKKRGPYKKKLQQTENSCTTSV